MPTCEADYPYARLTSTHTYAKLLNININMTNTMPITASKLREDVYRILDEVIETGQPVEVLRKGTVLKIVPEKAVSKLARLKKRNVFVGNPEDIIGMDWSKEWTELK